MDITHEVISYGQYSVYRQAWINQHHVIICWTVFRIQDQIFLRVFLIALSKIGSRYIAIRYNTALPTTQSATTNIDQTLNLNKTHPIARPQGRAMGCILYFTRRKILQRHRECTVWTASICINNQPYHLNRQHKIHLRVLIPSVIKHWAGAVRPLMTASNKTMALIIASCWFYH